MLNSAAGSSGKYWLSMELMSMLASSKPGTPVRLDMLDNALEQVCNFLALLKCGRRACSRGRDQLFNRLLTEVSCQYGCDGCHF